jgi:hypothetical protein
MSFAIALVSFGLAACKGEQGDPGPAGARGETGQAGAPGERGPMGLPGADGADGAMGAMGAMGPMGLPGAMGAMGPMGLPGAQGLPGLQGPPGEAGATGATGPAGTTGQSAIMVGGTAALTVTANTPLTLIPGLTTTVNVPAGARVLVTTDGGVAVNSQAATGATAVNIELIVVGQLPPAGGWQQVLADNGNLINSVNQWSMSSVLNLAAGNHTFTVQASGIAGILDSATVSGDATAAAQGQLSVVVLKL